MDILKFPHFNLYNIPEALRKLANDIEAGTRDAEAVVVCISTSKGKSDYCAFGRNIYWMTALGICTAAQLQITGDHDG